MSRFFRSPVYWHPQLYDGTQMDLWDVVVAPRAKEPIVGEALRDLEAKLRERFITFAMEHMPQAALVVQLRVQAESEEDARAAAVFIVEEAAKECQLEVRPAATHVQRIKA